MSRSTLRYYESIGLLKPASRSEGNYRRYGEQDLQRLEQIRLYRQTGLKLADIRSIVTRTGGDAEANIEYLNIRQEGVCSIREWSRKAQP